MVSMVFRLASYSAPCTGFLVYLSVLEDRTWVSAILIDKHLAKHMANGRYPARVCEY